MFVSAAQHARETRVCVLTTAAEQFPDFSWHLVRRRSVTWPVLPVLPVLPGQQALLLESLVLLFQSFRSWPCS